MNKMLFAFISIAAIAGPFSASAAVLEKPEDALIRALEDEYHAAAFYDTVMSKFGTVCPFANIIESERAHSSMLVDVMKSYGMPIPKNAQLGSAEIKVVVPGRLARPVAWELPLKSPIAIYTRRS